MNQSKAESSSRRSLIAGKYLIITLLGEGSFGKALLVEDIFSKCMLVVKTIIIPGTMSKKDKDNAYQEGKILEKLNHPNIIKFIEVIIEKQDICPPITSLHIVMDYADGGDMLKKIKDQHGKLFPEEQVIGWFIQICLAIKHIHDRKILHRDIKSQNIFLTQTGKVQLGDFGIAKCLNNSFDKARTIVGTPYYLSPEIINNEPYEYKSDVWSLGVLLYEMCMLTVPFNAQNLPQLTIKIIKGSYPPLSSSFSKEMSTVIKGMLNINMKQRPTINEILTYPIFKSKIKLFLTEDEYQREFPINIIRKFTFLPKEGERDKSSITRSCRKRSKDKQPMRSKQRNDSFDNQFFKHKVNKSDLKEKCNPFLIRNSNCKSNNQFIYKKKLTHLCKKPKLHSMDLSPQKYKPIQSDKKISKERSNDSTDPSYRKDDFEAKRSQERPGGKEEQKKNLILEEFMKNKQEKIKHSHQISENISNRMWFNNNIDSTEVITEDSIISTKIQMDKDSKEELNSQQMLLKIDTLRCDNDILNGISIKEPSVIDNDNDIRMSIDSSKIAEAMNSKPENEVIPLDLDIFQDNYKDSPLNCQQSFQNNPSKEDIISNDKKSQPSSIEPPIHEVLKHNIEGILGDYLYSNLYAFIRENITDDIIDYDYDKLTNKFHIAYPQISQQQLKKALLYIPDIYFLILTEANNT